MPVAAKGARLYLRLHKGKKVWVIRDGPKSIRTGLPENERGAAEERLAAYITQKHQPSRERNRHPSEIAIADVLNIYLADVAPQKARPKEVSARLLTLGEYFGVKTLASINGSACREYVKRRGSTTAARRELEDLRAAINHHRKEGYCSEIVGVALPDKSPSRERWITRKEAAKLIRAAWRYREIQKGKPTDRKSRQHVARFILVGLYSGTRNRAICGAALQPTIGRPYVDLDTGTFNRKAVGAKVTKKRQPAVRLHPRLLAHMRRWQAKGISNVAVIEFGGKPIERMAKAFRNVAHGANMPDVTPHILRHSAITWAMLGGADPWKVCDYFGITLEMLIRTYGHHHPDHGKGIFDAMRRMA